MTSGVQQHHLMDESVDQCLTIERSLQKFPIHLSVIYYSLSSLPLQSWTARGLGNGLIQHSILYTALFRVEWISLVCVHSYSRTILNHSGTILSFFVQGIALLGYEDTYTMAIPLHP